MSATRRVLVTDDDLMVREVYRAFFSRQSDYELCGEARNGAEAIVAYETHLPDLVLMDQQMPGVSGIEATETICQRWPDACVVVLTTFGANDYVVAALRAGAAGYLLKDVGGAALLTAMRQALAGDMPLSGSVRRELVASVVENRPVEVPEPANVGLSPRELELLGWLAQGLTNHQIGAQMFVSEGSVKQYLTHVARKLGVKSRTGILIRSIQLHLVDPHQLPPLRAEA